MTTYLHYLPRGVAAPELGSIQSIGGEDNYLWVRKQADWRTSGAYPPRQVDRDAARKLGCSLAEYLENTVPWRQECDLKIEGIFESKRPKKLPSRQRCMYLWDDRPDWKLDAAPMGFYVAEGTLIRVRPIPGENEVHRAPLHALDKTNNDFSKERKFDKRFKRKIGALAEIYWKGVDKPRRGTEVLLVGNYEVVPL